MPDFKRLQLVTGGEIDNLEIFQKMLNLEYLHLEMEVKRGDKVKFMASINEK